MEFLYYFGDVFTLPAFSLLIVGTLVGLILGAMPGLSPTMAVALAIPFTFQLEPVPGLILLGALYTSTVAGGAISAILLNIPGAPANIATTLDGHIMARKQQGTRALQLAFFASLWGGLFGVLLLIFTTPTLAQWALAFGPSQSFWVAILGVTIIGTLGNQSIVKGLLAGCIGLWISTIGFDDIFGAQRFIFHPALSGGIHIIPALIGLFAIPQVITLLAQGHQHSTVEIIRIKPHGISQAWHEIMARLRSLSTGTIIGSAVGLIPGVGGQIAGLVAYNQARNFSPERDKFGTGHPEGIIAAESANNAMVGPSLIPLLTLSIPGSPTAAVLLGGLIIHGIFPGPAMFTTHAEVVWPFINSMLLGQILMCVFGLFVARFIVQIVHTPRYVMAAMVMILAVFGSYAVQHSLHDVFIMLLLGTGMYFLERYGYSAAPLVLGLILGPIAEGSFVEGMMIAQAQQGVIPYFFTGTLNLTMIILIVASISYSTWLKICKRTR